MRLTKRWLAILMSVILCVSMMACAKKNDTDHGDDGEKAYSVTYNDVKLTLGANAENALEALGEPNFSQEVFDCGEGNSRMCYRYASLTLYTMKNTDGKETIDQIEVNDDLVETDKGIAIGSSVTALEEAHGKPTTKADDEWIYTSGSYQLIFDVEDGKVDGIGLLRKTK